MSAPWRWCPVCGAELVAGWPSCAACGACFAAPLPAGTYTPPPIPKPADYRTRWGLGLTVWACLLLWIPTLSLLGGLLFSIGSFLLFRDRHRISPEHARATFRAFLLPWAAFLPYAVSFGAFPWYGNEAYLDQLRLDGIRGLVLNFILATTVPTGLLVVSLALQGHHLTPARKPLWAATVLLLALVLVATVLAYLDVASGTSPCGSPRSSVS